FEAADRDHEVRRRLRHWLEGQEAAEALAAAAGREPGARVFSSERLQIIAYAPGPIATACSKWCERLTHNPRLFERQLRGFAHLVPESLRPGLSRLFHYKRSEPESFSALLV